MKKYWIITIVLLLVVGGGAFFGGMKYQQGKRPNFGAANRGQFQGARSGFRPVSGEIVSTDSNSITVKLQDNSSKIVLFNDKTQINKASQATKDDLKTGDKVAVFGQANPDGSVTAQNIQLNPIMGNSAGRP